MSNSITEVFTGKSSRYFPLCLVIGIGDLRESFPLCQVGCLFWSCKILYTGRMALLIYFLDFFGFTSLPWSAQTGFWCCCTADSVMYWKHQILFKPASQQRLECVQVGCSAWKASQEAGRVVSSWQSSLGSPEMADVVTRLILGTWEQTSSRMLY